MTTPDDVQKYAEGLLKEQRYDEAIPLFQKLWEQAEKQNKWTGWRYARALRGAGRSQEALEVCREVYTLDANFEQGRDTYALCIYDLEIKARSQDEVAFFKAANAIMKLAKPGQFTHTLTVFAVLKFLKTDEEGDAKVVNPRRVLEWIDRLDPLQLKTEVQMGRDGKPFPSEYERYASAKSKALFALESPEEVLACCHEAKKVLGNKATGLHWFTWREGKALALMGEHEQAIASFEQVMAVKTDWYMHQALAESLRNVGNLDRALYHAAQAALGRAPIPFKWKIYVLLADIYRLQGDVNHARLHIQLAYSVRQREGWKESPNVRHLLAELKYEPKQEDVVPKDVERKMQVIWQNIKPQIPTSHQGRVALIHTNGKSGIVQDLVGTKYFFGMRDVVGGAESLAHGVPIRFNLKEVVNHKTNLPECHAKDIQLIPEVESHV